MFGRRGGDFNARRFWSWFAAEAQGLFNGMEALQRGESDAEWALIGLNERLKRYDARLTADLARGLDGACELTVTGEAASTAALLANAPPLRGWRFRNGEVAALAPRIPFRVAPRPAFDASRIEARHEAYAPEAAPAV